MLTDRQLLSKTGDFQPLAMLYRLNELSRFQAKEVVGSSIQTRQNHLLILKRANPPRGRSGQVHIRNLLTHLATEGFYLLAISITSLS